MPAKNCVRQVDNDAYSNSNIVAEKVYLIKILTARKLSDIILFSNLAKDQTESTMYYRKILILVLNINLILFLHAGCDTT